MRMTQRDAEKMSARLVYDEREADKAKAAGDSAKEKRYRDRAERRRKLLDAHHETFRKPQQS